MMDLGKLVKDPRGHEALRQHHGDVELEVYATGEGVQRSRCAAGDPLVFEQGDDWAITATALTSKLWLVKKDAKGEWQARDVATIGDPAKIPLPVDISIAADGKGLWVNTFMDGMTHYFDLTNPEAPKETYSSHTGSQVNMVSQSWDGKRVYITTSLLANWDKKGADDQQFLKLFSWDGKELKEQWTVDFYKAKLGRAHHMKFGASTTQAAYSPGTDSPSTKLATNR